MSFTIECFYYVVLGQEEDSGYFPGSALQVTNLLSVVLQDSLANIELLPVEPQSKQLMTSDQDTKVVAEPQGQRVQEGKDSTHLVSGRPGQRWPVHPLLL